MDINHCSCYRSHWMRTVMHTGTAANGSSSTVCMDTSTLLTLIELACGPLEDYIMKERVIDVVLVILLCGWCYWLYTWY